MGNNASVNQEICVCIQSVQTVVNELFTVERASGEKEEGWTISEAHPCPTGNCPEWVTSHASKHLGHDGKWRIFMQNHQSQPGLHSCDWIRLEAISPTSFNGDKDRIRVWRKAVEEILETQETLRVKESEEDELLKKKWEYQRQLDQEREEKEFYKDTAYVISYKYDLFGMYEVTESSGSYTFVKKGSRFKAQGLDYQTVPISETMGSGEFEGVTPDKIKQYSKSNPSC